MRCNQGGVRCGLVATRDMGSFQLPALRRWFGCAITVIMLVELGACAVADHSPSVAAGTADNSPTVVPGATKGSRTAHPVAPKHSVAALPEAPKSSETIQPFAPKNPGRSTPSVAKKPSGVVPPDHIVVVIFENEHRSNVIGNPRAAYLNKLAGKGANMTRSYGITHPSQPNYLALFSGTTHGVSSNACLRRFKKKQNLGSQLRRAGLSFTGYAEALPQTGFT